MTRSAPTLANYADLARDPMSPDLRECTMTSGQVAKRLYVDHSTVWRWSNEGKLPFAMTAGGHRRYRPSDIEALAQRLERGERLGPIGQGGLTDG